MASCVRSCHRADLDGRDIVQEQRAEIERLRAALEFYADPASWKKQHDPDNDVQIPDFYSETSFADTAIAALAR